MQHITRRNTLKSLAAVGALAPALGPIAALAQTTDTDAILREIDPDFRAGALQAMGPNGFPPIGPHNLATIRATKLPKQPPLKVSVEKKTIAGLPGNPAVTIYVLNAGSAGASKPAILHTHGGGFIVATAEMDLPRLQNFCLELDCVLVTVDYRLAPETTFAGSTQDNYAGLKWLYENAASVGVDPRRIALMGESAGGGHAALLAIMARDRKEIPIAFQCLIFPMLDDRTVNRKPNTPATGKVGWTPESNRFGWRSFLGVEPGGKTAPAGSVPARVADLRGLPPTFISVGTLDLFAVEDVEYALRLLQSGVPVELHLLPGLYHGFPVIAPKAPVTLQYDQTVFAALRKGMRRPE